MSEKEESIKSKIEKSIIFIKWRLDLLSEQIDGVEIPEENEDSISSKFFEMAKELDELVDILIPINETEG